MEAFNLDYSASHGGGKGKTRDIFHNAFSAESWLKWQNRESEQARTGVCGYKKEWKMEDERKRARNKRRHLERTSRGSSLHNLFVKSSVPYFRDANKISDVVDRQKIPRISFLAPGI